MSELRWTLLLLGVLFIIVLAWWERRRPRQASGALERAGPRDTVESATRTVREPPLTLPEIHAREPLGGRAPPVVELTAEPRAVPVLAPAAADAARPGSEASEQANDAGADQDPAAPADDIRADAETAAEPAAPPPPRESLPELPAGPEPLVSWPSETERRILALRLVAPLPERFAGRSLRQALAAEGFVLGPFAIFHKPDDERRAVLSAASLTRPGTFDMQTMDSQHYGGLSLFAVLPGPKSPPQAFEELVFAARNLNERLQGVLQDERGSPLTPARIAQLREQVRAGTRS